MSTTASADSLHNARTHTQTQLDTSGYINNINNTLIYTNKNNNNNRVVSVPWRNFPKTKRTWQLCVLTAANRIYVSVNNSRTHEARVMSTSLIAANRPSNLPQVLSLRDLFVFMLALLCFCVATVFSVNNDLYITPCAEKQKKP